MAKRSNGIVRQAAAAFVATDVALEELHDEAHMINDAVEPTEDDVVLTGEIVDEDTVTAVDDTVVDETIAVNLNDAAVPAMVEAKTNKRVRLYQAGETIVREAKMPAQLSQIVNWLVETKFIGTGTQIIEKMIEEDKIVTRQDPAVLFAFYARRLEGMGIVRS